jgi:hypothetical protein
LETIVRHYPAGTDPQFVRDEHDEWRRKYGWNGALIAIVETKTATALEPLSAFMSIVGFPFQLPVFLDVLRSAQPSACDIYLRWLTDDATRKEAGVVTREVLGFLKKNDPAAAYQRLAALRVQDIAMLNHTVRGQGRVLVDAKFDPNDAQSVAAFRDHFEAWAASAELP